MPAGPSAARTKGAGYPADIVTNTYGRLAVRNDGRVIGEF
jgi:hypothetical protein